MISRLLIASSLLVLATQTMRAQSAADYFNSGAQYYISNNIPDALKKVESGLQAFPSDVKLKKLEELLKQQQQQQQQQNQQNQQNQSQQNKNSQSQKSQSQQQQQQNQQNQQKQNQQQQNQQAQNQSNAQKQQQNEQNQQQQAQEQKDKNGKDQGQQVAEAGKMTPEEAKKLLDAQKGNEQILPNRPSGQPENANTPIKDW
jgi:Ca-activated chloride channel homolog